MTSNTYYCVFQAPSSNEPLRSAVPKVLLTNLDQVQQDVVREYLERQMLMNIRMNTLNSDYGTLNHPSFFDKDSPETHRGYFCYHYFFVSEKEEDKYPWNFAVCLLHPFVDNLDLFMPDLDRFCSKLGTYLVAGTSIDLKSLKRAMSEWVFQSMEYIVRCVLCWVDVADVILYCFLIGRKFDIEVDPVNQQLKHDLLQLKSAINVLQILHARSPSTDARAPVPENEILGPVRIQVSSTHQKCYCTTSNQFCKSWAASLRVKAERNDYVAIRQDVEEKKFEVVGQLNILRRRINSARNNDYSLYLTYLRLRDNPNADVLLELLKLQTSFLDVAGCDPLFLDTTQVLFAFWDEQQQAKQTYGKLKRESHQTESAA